MFTRIPSALHLLNRNPGEPFQIRSTMKPCLGQVIRSHFTAFRESLSRRRRVGLAPHTEGHARVMGKGRTKGANASLAAAFSSSLVHGLLSRFL